MSREAELAGLLAAEPRPILVAAHTDIQYWKFLDTFGIDRGLARRCQVDHDWRGWTEKTLFLLPEWELSFRRGDPDRALYFWKQRGNRVHEVTDEQVEGRDAPKPRPEPRAASKVHEMEMAHRRYDLARYPQTQAQAIADHYSHLAGAAADLALLLRQRRYNPQQPPETAEKIAYLVKQITTQHERDFGLTLEWPMQEFTEQ